jgi:lipopolysaccharide biosynthesis glycosyltransferase
LELNHITLAFDSQEKYSVVLIKNIVDLSDAMDLTFHIFLPKNTDYSEHESKLNKWNILYKVYFIDDILINDLQINKDVYPWISNSAFYRLLIPELLPDSVFTYLYLDTDIWVNFDIRELFHHYKKEAPLIVASVGMGFNSGVMLIEKNIFSKWLPFEKAKSLIKEHNNESDNELLIDYFDNLNQFVGFEFNYPVYFHAISSEYLGVFLNNPLRYIGLSVKKRSLNIKLKNIKIAHFAGPYKPWNFNNSLPYSRNWRNLYYEIYNEYPWSRVTTFDRLSRLSFHFKIIRIKVVNIIKIILINFGLIGMVRKMKYKLFN